MREWSRTLRGCITPPSRPRKCTRPSSHRLTASSKGTLASRHIFWDLTVDVLATNLCLLVKFVWIFIYISGGRLEWRYRALHVGEVTHFASSSSGLYHVPTSKSVAFSCTWDSSKHFHVSSTVDEDFSISAKFFDADCVVFIVGSYLFIRDFHMLVVTPWLFSLSLLQSLLVSSLIQSWQKHQWATNTM